MPKVPTAREAGLGLRRVEPVAIPRRSVSLPSIRVPRDGSGEAVAGLGRALSGFGDGLGELALEQAERERRAHRQALLKEAETASLAAIGDLLRHPERGYLNSRGRAALLAREETLEALDRIGRRSLEGLEPTLRPAFESLWAGQRARAAEAVDGHGRGQFAAWLDAVDLGQLRAAREQAAASGGAPEPVGEALARGRDGLAALAERHGWPARQLAEAERALRSRLHEAAVHGLLERDELGAAWAYYRTAEAELAEPDRRALRPLLAHARRQAAEQARSAAADRLLADWQARGLAPEQQRAEAGRLRSPGLRTTTLRRLERREAEGRRRQRAQNRQALAEARRAVGQGIWPEDLPFQVARHLTEPQRQALDDWSDRLAAGEFPMSDRLALHRLRRLALDDPAAFAALDLFTEGRNRLDDHDYAGLERLQEAMIARGAGRASAAQLALLDRQAEIAGATAAG